MVCRRESKKAVLKAGWDLDLSHVTRADNGQCREELGTASVEISLTSAQQSIRRSLSSLSFDRASIVF